MSSLPNGVFVVLFKKENKNPLLSKIYIVKHNYGEKKFSLPGGALQTGENPESAALREVQEETNLRLKNVCLLGTFLSRKNSGTIVFLYKALAGGIEKIIDPNEIAEIQVVTVGQALTEYNLYPAQRILLAAYVVGKEQQEFIIDYLSAPENDQISYL